MSDKRLIETAFPLAEASAASLHEKNMRHGHISTMHMWPARRPLAASRAAIAAALLSDPGDDEARRQLVRRLGGRLKLKKQTKSEAGKKVEAAKVEGDGGILWWGQESSPDVDWFCEKIRAAHGGRAPRVLDPFAGGGAIPLEAMRLGCEVAANDLNPVAWFILKCTLEYPQRLAGQTWPLPSHAMRDAAFAKAFLKAHGLKGARLDDATATMAATGRGEPVQRGFLEDWPWERAELGWQIRAWGAWVLAGARQQLAARYPIYAEWQTLDPESKTEAKPLELLPATMSAQAAVHALNTGIAPAALRDPRSPRWVAKPTVAYLWARTVSCKSCRAIIPLLKTRWLCRKDSKRVLLEMARNDAKNGVEFAVRRGIPMSTGTASARRAADRALGAGTMSRTGVRCPCCGALMSMDDLQHEARSGRFRAVMTAVVQNGPFSKEYRDPTEKERTVAATTRAELDAVFERLPFGIPCEPIPPERPSPNTRGVSGLTRYGIDHWGKVFTDRQMLVLGTLANSVREADKAMAALDYPTVWRVALVSYLALASDRVADYGSVLCSWASSGEFIRGTFVRFALSIIWDYAEVNPLSDVTGGYFGAVEWVAKAASHVTKAVISAPACSITLSNAIEEATGRFDAVVTDPPYYDAIPYSDLMDFFHLWLRRALYGLDESFTAAFTPPTGPKWDPIRQEGELVDQPGRFGANRVASRAAYEAGMARSFRSFYGALTENGARVLVFANKQPEAWDYRANQGGFCRRCLMAD
jgi:putative DNA methylase